LILGTFVFIASVCIALKMGFEFYDPSIIIFLMFVAMGPLIILTIIAFWGIVGRLFTLRQGKRLFGLVYSGQLLGVILLSFLTKPLLLLLGDIENFLLISSVAVVVAFLIQIKITENYSDKFIIENDEEKKISKNTSLSVIYKNKYVFVIAGFVILSVIAAFFIYYTFLGVTRLMYPTTVELAGFLGLFIASANIFSFLVRTFVHSKILTHYGLKFTLVLIPSLLAFFTIISIVVGLIWGYDINSPQFIFYFIIIALSRLFYITLKDSVQIPTFEIIFQSLNRNIRFVVQAAIDGVVNEFAAIFSGVLLVLFALISGFELLHYSFILMFVLALWIITSIKLYKEYKTTLLDSLSEKQSIDWETANYNNVKSVLKRKIMSKNDAEIICSHKIELLFAPKSYEVNLFSLLSNSSDAIRLYAAENVKELMFLDAFPFVQRQLIVEENKEIRFVLSQTTELFNSISKRQYSYEQLSKLVMSIHTYDRRLAARIIQKTNLDENYQLLMILMRDVERLVRIDAIYTASKIKSPLLINTLIDNLLVSKYSKYAYWALLEFGEIAVSYLNRSYYRSGLTKQNQTNIIKLIGQLGGSKAVDILFNKLSIATRDVQLMIVKLLISNKFVANEEQKSILKQVLKQNVGIVAWNLNIYNEAFTTKLEFSLKDALKNEIVSSYNAVYDILSIMYDAKSISHVKENIDSADSELMSYAIELMDLFVDEDVKPYLFIIFEDVLIPEKIEKLRYFFSFRSYYELTLLEEIIDRDINCINRWTKALAIINLQRIKILMISESVVAHVYNEDRLLRQLSGLIVYKYDFEKYPDYWSRIDKKYRLELEDIIVKQKKQSMFDVVKQLKSFASFSILSEHDVLIVAEKLAIKNIEKGEEIEFYQNEMPFYIIKSGQIDVIVNNETIDTLSQGNIVDTVMFNDINNNKILAVTDDVELYVVDNYARAELMENSRFVEMLLNIKKYNLELSRVN
jgi:ATP:ADP antiporter, AAA family